MNTGEMPKGAEHNNEKNKKTVGYLLDTNVFCEAMKQKPNANALAWHKQQNAETLYICSITFAEVLFGIEVLPQGKRKEALAQSLPHLLSFFESRILDFDCDAARHHAELAVMARKVGLGFPPPDSYIAAIAKSHNLIVVTRDVAPFRAVGLAVINPFE